MKFMDPGCDICCPACKHECADPIKMKISSEHGHCAWLFPSYAVSLLGAKSRHVGDKSEIMRPEHSEHPELTGRQVGDKWKTSMKSCGQSTESIRAYWETSGRQMGDKREIMRPER